MDKDIQQEFETLGKAVKEGFDGVDKRFDVVEHRLDGVEREVKDLRATMQNQYVSKSYLDVKLADHTAAILERIDRKYEREKQFKTGVLDILKRNQLASQEEIQSLEQLI